MKKSNITFEPHPDRVLVKCTKESYDSLFYKNVKRDDGTQVQLFTSLEHGEGYDLRYAQNVSTGVIVAIGENVKNVLPSDLAILDYMVSNDSDSLIGFVGGDRLVSLPAQTTYHEKDSSPSITMRKAFVKGDIEDLSKILGVVRNDKLIAFSPYVFLEFKSKTIMAVSALGFEVNTEEGAVITRDIISAPDSSGYKDGDTVFLQEEGMFFRDIGGRRICVCFEKDILGKK